MKNLYYKLANGNWVDRYDIETAFYISTEAKCTTDSKEFVRWFFPLLGESILAVKKGDDPELIEELLKSRQKNKAINLMIGPIALIGSRNSFIAENAKVGMMKNGQERTVHGKMKI